MAPRPNLSSSFREFLEKKWAIPITFEIVQGGGASFNNMEEEMSLSTATLSKRLKDGEHLGLWDTVADRGSEGRSRQKYVPTDKGHKLWILMADTGIFETYVEYQTYKSEFEEAAQEFKEAVSEAEKEEELQPEWVEPAEPRAEARDTIRDIDPPNSPFDLNRQLEETDTGDDSEPIEPPSDDPDAENTSEMSTAELLMKMFEQEGIPKNKPDDSDIDIEELEKIVNENSMWDDEESG